MINHMVKYKDYSNPGQGKKATSLSVLCDESDASPWQGTPGDGGNAAMTFEEVVDQGDRI
jgi:hypothetical protein